MSWTTSADLRDQVRRLWEHGKILGSGMTGATLFPLKLSLRRPDARQSMYREPLLLKTPAWTELPNDMR